MSAFITGLLSLSGYPLIAAICGLIVLEELGIPMPMAPGDLLLVLAGVSIATGRVNAVVAVTAVYASALVGAVCGREIFMRIGKSALPRIAALLHAGDRVDRLTARLRRGGSGAVFLGRITPGMRINTTYLSGLVALPRRTFLIGVVPGIAVYQFVFICLGAWLGVDVLTTIKQHMPEPGELVVLVAVVVGSALAGRALIKYFRTRAHVVAPTAGPSSVSST